MPTSRYGSNFQSILLYLSNIGKLMSLEIINSSKLQLSQLMIDNMIISRNGNINIIDDVENPLVLKVASDYLLLSLIYTLLGTTGLNLVWVAKRNSYWNLYQY